jgi:hypothetical protein
MPVPVFPLLGPFSAPLLLDPAMVFTPLTIGVGLFSVLCGVGIGVWVDRASDARMARAARSRPSSAAPRQAA